MYMQQAVMQALFYAGVNGLLLLEIRYKCSRQY